MTDEADHGDDAYLWDKSGEPDPEVRRLEEALAPLRYDGAIPAPANQGGGWLTRGLAAAAAIAIVAWGAWSVSDDPRPTEIAAGEEAPAWAVEHLSGAARVGGSVTRDLRELPVGTWLETAQGASVRVHVPVIGRVDVAPETRMRIKATGTDEHRIELQRGRIAARVDAPPRLFVVDTPSATAVDLGCAYTLDVDDRGGGALRVTSGVVALESPAGPASIVPAGAMCETRPGRGPGTPVFVDAPTELRSAVGLIDFVPGRGDEALREGVVALDEVMLETWRDELEWGWLGWGD
jgi:hypothetical protein